MDKQTEIELQAAAFRRLQQHLMEEPHGRAEYRHDEPGRVLPQLPVALVSGSGQ